VSVGFSIILNFSFFVILETVYDIFVIAVGLVTRAFDYQERSSPKSTVVLHGTLNLACSVFLFPHQDIGLIYA